MCVCSPDSNNNGTSKAHPLGSNCLPIGRVFFVDHSRTQKRSDDRFRVTWNQGAPVFSFVECAPVSSLSASPLVGTRSEEGTGCAAPSGPAVRPRSNVCLNELFRPFLELFSIGRESAWASHGAMVREIVRRTGFRNGCNTTRRFLTFRDPRLVILNELYARPSFDGFRLEQIVCRQSPTVTRGVRLRRRPHLRLPVGRRCRVSGSFETEYKPRTLRIYTNDNEHTITLNGGSLGSWVDEERS